MIQAAKFFHQTRAQKFFWQVRLYLPQHPGYISIARRGKWQWFAQQMAEKQGGISPAFLVSPAAVWGMAGPACAGA